MSGSYLSPSQVGWNPQSEEALAQAVDLGLLEETHYLELKGLVPPGKVANKELARDLAQFGIDGGVLLVGVREQEGAPLLSPVPLPGLCERIEQVAVTRIDPPLFVACTEIRSAADDSIGYVVVRVPPSASAPHMVDGVYPARGDKSRRQLTDTEVARYHQARQTSTAGLSKLLDEYVARDPVPVELRKQARLFVVASPTNPRPEMLLGLFDGGSAQARLFGLIGAAERVPGLQENALLPPRMSYASSFGTRADGVAMTSGLGINRSVESNTRGDVNDIFEIEFTEEGMLRVFNSRLSDQPSGGSDQRILDTTLPQTVRQTVNLTAGIAQTVGYFGMWKLGVVATGVAGLVIWRDRAGFWDLPPYPSDQNEYRAMTTASTIELYQQPGAVTVRLVGRYLRTLKLSTDPRVTPFIT